MDENLDENIFANKTMPLMRKYQGGMFYVYITKKSAGIIQI